MKRFAEIVEIKAERIEDYKKLHASVWPEMLRIIKDCGIRNYSIYLRRLPDAKYYLFAYYEYVGENFEADMYKMSKNPITQKWWDLCKPCHTPLADRPESAWWAPAEEVFHCN